ncbi:hypothetical protein H0H81_001727 [Sphagnurus paluster]|uniref:G domain-containing protein n=1 Tax=Sphagnurus paluster TaxID=117069 RepID=A0A9P7FTM0_9AGAR|nr:hypothetical protein H0H81_001727 [Sphagnurus paluster]
MANIEAGHAPPPYTTEPSVHVIPDSHPEQAGAMSTALPQYRRHNEIVRPGGPTRPNILIFGETGIGKSSVINLIAGTTVAGVSGEAQGSTFESRAYPITINDQIINFWDTAGLNEGEHGTVPAQQAMRNLKDLVTVLGDGLSLLVCCIRAARFRTIWKVNYELFVRIICQHRVPVVLVVTGLENETPMEGWWRENGMEFAKFGMHFHGHACITSTRGKQLKTGEYMYQEEYDESVHVIRRLVADRCVGEPQTMPSETEITSTMAGYFYQNSEQANRYRSREQRVHRRETRDADSHSGGYNTNPIIQVLSFIGRCLSYI